MADPDIQTKMRKLQEDPELKEMFDDIRANGPQTALKYQQARGALPSGSGVGPGRSGGRGLGRGRAWTDGRRRSRAVADRPCRSLSPPLSPQDPVWSAKLEAKMDALGIKAPGSAPPAPPTPPAEIETLLQAARWGDLEAVEDLLAVGRSADDADPEGRTPLHLAVAHGHARVLSALLDAKANVEATDAKGNTPLHYAAGYGRGAEVSMLLEAGANRDARNATGKTALDLCRLSPENPLGKDEDILYRLGDETAGVE